MYKCRVSPMSCTQDGLCCMYCQEKNSCKNPCDGTIPKFTYCPAKYRTDAELENSVLSVFLTEALPVMKQLCDLEQTLEKIMKVYGVSAFENEYLKVISIRGNNWIKVK